MLIALASSMQGLCDAPRHSLRISSSELHQGGSDEASKDERVLKKIQPKEPTLMQQTLMAGTIHMFSLFETYFPKFFCNSRSFCYLVTFLAL